MAGVVLNKTGQSRKRNRGHDAARIPSLDGLRAISIAFVIFGHLCGTQNFLPATAASTAGDLANLGVRTFFVISGYLITRLLIEEKERTGRVSLLAFYIRRTFRIFPAFYAFLLVVTALTALGYIDVRRSVLASAATYTINFRYDREWWVGHLWSLAVEEQFYVTWPALFILLGIRRSRYAALTMIAAAPIVRVVILLFFPEHRPGLGTVFPTIADAIATGCLLACVAGRLESYPRYLEFLRSQWFYAVPVAAFAINGMPGTKINMAVSQTIINACIAVCIHRFVLYPGGRIGNILNSAPFVYIGVLSYSLYLWQQLFLNRHSDDWWSAFPINVVFAFVCAILSYSLVEKPFLRMRRRVEARLLRRTTAVAASASISG